MTTLNYQVGASGDSGRCDNTGYFTTYGIYVGNYSLNTTDGWCRFTGVTIPVGSTITSAYISYYGGFGSVCPIASSIYFEKVANPSAPSSQSDYISRTKTTNHVSWNPSIFNFGTWYNSPDLTAIINELMSSYSYASGAAMQVLHYDAGSSDGSFINATSYDDDSIHAPKLVIVYSSGSVNHYYVSTSDGVRIQDSAYGAKHIQMSVSEGMRSGDADTNKYRGMPTIFDGTKLQDTISTLLKTFPTLTEGVKLNDLSSTRSKTFVNVPEGFKIADIISATAAVNHYFMTLGEGVKSNDSIASKLKFQPAINESTIINAVITSRTLYHILVNEGISVQDLLSNFYKLAISEGFSVQDAEYYTQEIYTLIIGGSLLASREIGGSKTYTRSI